MNCHCGAYINPIWANCQRCGMLTTLRELEMFAGTDWPDIKDDPVLLDAFKRASEGLEQLKTGMVPLHYTKSVLCKNCGSVKLWASCPDEVEACPWCFVRVD